MEQAPNWQVEFSQQAIFRMNEFTPRIQKCLEDLSEEEVWQKPNSSSNSVANLILHLCGNITQYIISSLGQQPDQRQRNAEFEAQGGLNKAELINQLQATVEKANEIIAQQRPESLLKVRSVQGFQFSGIGIIMHVVEHYSYHTGQIAFWTKYLKNKDLGFYADMDLNAKNE